jgi:chromosome segregation ATPase
MVASGPEGAAVVGAATHGVEPAESGRLYILELYQQVLDQRDALQQEVAALHADLELAQKEIEGLGGRATDGESRVGALEQEVASLRAENQDLAGRLTTAQVRRLEAEKLLLQAKIEIQRARSEADAEGVARKDEGK